MQEGGPLWTAPGGAGLALNNYSINKVRLLLLLSACGSGALRRCGTRTRKPRHRRSWAARTRQRFMA